jgi:hypothetical protein
VNEAVSCQPSGVTAVPATPPRYLIDTYLDFIQAEGMPVIEGFGIDLLGVETRPWARLGPVNGN